MFSNIANYLHELGTVARSALVRKNCNVTLGHNMFYNITNYLHELGTVAHSKTDSQIWLPAFYFK